GERDRRQQPGAALRQLLLAGGPYRARGGVYRVRRLGGAENLQQIGGTSGKAADGQERADRIRHHAVSQNTKGSGLGAFLRAAMQVSNTPSVLYATGAAQVMRRASITGGSPTTASKRPPGLRLFGSSSGMTGTEPVRMIASYGSYFAQPRAASPA